MNGDVIVMRPIELKRLELIKKAIARELTQVEVSDFLGISYRQVKRMVRRVKEEGDKGIVHKLRGKINCRRIKDAIKVKVLKVYVDRYGDFGATLAREKLEKHEGIKLSRETLRKWLRQEGHEATKRRKRKHRLWRARKEYYGEMVQMDGSHHDWLEGRGPRLVLMGYIDDATNRAHGWFYEYEGTIPAMDSFKKYVVKYGIPQSVYLDCSPTYKATVRETFKAKFEGQGTGLSEFQRAMTELGVRVIHAHSPQAKGRIERLFRTLQDRLVKELRLARVKTIEEANEVLKEYLIDHNRRYLIEPARLANLHRRCPSDKELEEILCLKKVHPLRNDYTVIHESKLYQVMERTSTRSIEVREFIDGRMALMGRGRSLKYKQIEQSPVKRRKRLGRKVGSGRVRLRVERWVNLYPRSPLSAALS